MHRIDGPGATVDGKFTEGDPVGGIQATVVTDDFLNDVQEELISILTAAGVTPTKGTQDQVLQSFYKLVQAQKATAFTTAGTSTALTLTPTPAIQSYTANLRFTVKFSVDSGLSPTLNISSKGDKALKQYGGGGSKVAAVFANGQIGDVVYDGTDLVLLDQLPVTSDLLNTVRLDVASSAAINLITAAPNTRNINITGSAGVTSFVVSAGQVYFVRFAGSVSLANNANIVTQTGATITTQAGDTCLIRSTSTNIVEILCYTRGMPQAIGDGQTWQDVTASRSSGVSYLNSSGRPIQMCVVVTDGGSTGSWSATVGGILFDLGNPASAGGMVSFVIPSGVSYSVSLGGNTLTKWAELK